jgi:hypothetical protein
MVEDDVRYPVIVDTDALVTVANTSLWPRIVETLQLTTTNVCYHELTRHGCGELLRGEGWVGYQAIIDR